MDIQLPEELWWRIADFLSVHDRGVLRRTWGPWRAAMCNYLKGAHLCVSSSGISMTMALWAMSEGVTIQAVCESAAAQGNQSVIALLSVSVCRDIDWTPLVGNAGAHGQVELWKWLMEQCLGRRWLNWGSIFNCIAAAGNLDMLIMAIPQAPDRVSPQIVEVAAQHGHLHVLDYAKRQGHYMGNVANIALHCGAYRGRLDVIQWADRNRTPQDHLDINLIFIATSNWVDLEVLEYLRQMGVRVMGTRNAAERGDITMLEWLLEHGAQWDCDTMAAAIGEDELVTAKWLRSQGCPWSIRSMPEKMETLQWLWDEGGPWQDECIAAMVAAGGRAGVEWLRERGIASNTLCLAGAIRRKDWKLVQELQAKGIS